MQLWAGIRVIAAIAFAAFHPSPRQVHPHHGRGPFERSYVVASVHAASGHNPFAVDRQVNVAFLDMERGRGRRGHEIAWWARCNSAQGPVRVLPGRIKVAERWVEETAVGCIGRSGREDDWLDRFFRAGPRWRVHGEDLVLAAPVGTLILRPR